MPKNDSKEIQSARAWKAVRESVLRAEAAHAETSRLVRLMQAPTVAGDRRSEGEGLTRRLRDAYVMEEIAEADAKRFAAEWAAGATPREKRMLFPIGRRRARPAAISTPSVNDDAFCASCSFDPDSGLLVARCHDCAKARVEVEVHR